MRRSLEPNSDRGDVHGALHYDTALTAGWPIATGASACRHLIGNRLKITGACWGLDGAEAILKLRALRDNGGFEEYRRYHGSDAGLGDRLTCPTPGAAT